jgi:predicted RNA-binding Zn ribbon-like protein
MPKSEHPDFRDGMPFLGGSLWIDLLNTTPVIAGQALDLIGDPASLRRWAALAGLEAEGRADEGEVARTRDLRDLLRAGFEALAKGRAPDGALVDRLNDLLADVSIRLNVERSEDAPAGIVLHSHETVAGDPLAVAAALDFARFATKAEPERLRHCANPSCTMVFHDHGKNNRRRWCSMAACGNRDKVASYRARKRGEA